MGKQQEDWFNDYPKSEVNVGSIIALVIGGILLLGILAYTLCYVSGKGDLIAYLKHQARVHLQHNTSSASPEVNAGQ